MKFHLRKSQDETTSIALEVNTDNLILATENCSLGQGTLASPIIADSFASFVGSDFPSFNAGETIEFEIEPDDSQYDAEVVCLLLNSIGKEDNYNSQMTEELFRSVFYCGNGSNATPMIDGVLSVYPDTPTSAGLTINASEDATKEFYFSYSIIFSMELNGQLYYYIIDPIIKVRGSSYPN
ncbi:hypothetical protein [Flavicella sediminum]|uniref:hypothetical protein n=1 Tax=Flavicella sediminum TaxID=2585141 RepID=UPI001123B1F0|nr:hypothetical protein [Flavicella sediminum]